MIRKELWDKTVSILVKAYLNDTLQHCNCYACAVGNLVAANLGLGFVPTQYFECIKIKWDCGIDNLSDYPGTVGWGQAFSTTGKYQSRNFDIVNTSDIVKKQIDSTGYSVTELAKIEFSFETASNRGDYIFNGLMSVIDTLMQIHEATDTEAEQAKSLFTKELAVKVD